MSVQDAKNTKKDFRVTRVIQAPVDQVWNAWVDPEMVKRWWGPEGFTAPVVRVDFREGGTTLVSMRAPEGYEIFNTWTYQKIEPMRSIQFVSRFSDADGNAIDPGAVGLPPAIPAEVPHAVTFRSLDSGRTEMTIHESGYGSDEVAELSKAGQEQVVDKFAAIFASRTAA